MSSVESSSDLSQSQEVTLDVGKISQEIKSLAEDADGNPETQKQLNDALTDAAIDTLKKLDPSTINDLKNSVLLILENHGNQSGFEQSNQRFVKLAEALGLEKNADGTWGEKDNTTGSASPEDVDSTEDTAKVELPESPLKGELEGIEEGEDGSKESKLYSNLVRNGPEEGQEDTSEQGLRLYEATAKLSDQISKINEFLLNDKLKDNEDINGLKDFLENVQKVIGNTTEKNVQLLQKYIFDNLEGQDKTDFGNKSCKKNGEFDGKFGVGTLAGLNKVLENIGGYIDEVSDKLNESKDQEDVQKLNAVKANSDVNYVQGSGDANLKSWLTDLPEGATVDFKDDNEKAKLNTSGIQTITLKISFNGHEKEIQVTVNVTDGSSPEQDSDGSAEQNRRQSETQPLSVDGKQYLPMENKPSFYPEGAVFYSSVAVPETSTSENEGDSQTPDNQPRFATESNEVDGDGIYFMKVGDNTYEVKIDNLGNLCPVAKNIDSGKPVIFEGNDSGKKYLANKLPQMSGENAGSIYFDWNGKDYVMGIRGYDNTITVEPMTIAGLWLKGNAGERGATISESLAFLNLTNYLRNVGKYKDVEFRNDNPDLKMIGSELYVRVNRRKNVSLDDNGNPVKNGKWLHINKEEFGLTSDTGLMKRFIKYNNHEDRNDNWDTKTPNKYYATVQL